MMRDGSADRLSPPAADIRAQDPDRYLATLFAPAEIRDALFSLYAFDHEIAKIKRLVREPMAGLIRLQWWRDAIGGIETGKVPAHPILPGLSLAITRHGLDRGCLDAAIGARERELEEEPPATIADFERHLMVANGGIAKGAVKILGHEDPLSLSVAERVGLALGVLEKLRGLESAKESFSPWLPTTRLQERDLSEERLDQQRDDGDMPEAKADSIRNSLATLGRRYIAEARRDQAAIPRRLLPAFFPGTLADIRLRDLKRPETHPALAAAPYRLLWHWLRGRF